MAGCHQLREELNIFHHCIMLSSIAISQDFKVDQIDLLKSTSDKLTHDHKRGIWNSINEKSHFIAWVKEPVRVGARGT
jgi:predicted KAP-like P-loop ATPase